MEKQESWGKGLLCHRVPYRLASETSCPFVAKLTQVLFQSHQSPQIKSQYFDVKFTYVAKKKKKRIMASFQSRLPRMEH